MTILHGIPEEMRNAAVAMYDEAFGAKFAVAIPNGQRRLKLLESSLDLRFAFAAVAADELIGLAGYKTEAGSLTDGMTYPSLVKELGAIRGTWAALVLSLYERSRRPGELLMDGIVVDACARGQGVGSRLLEEMVSFAFASGFKSVRLDVIDTNPKARRLYERHGFVATGTEHFGYLRWLLGFGASTTLVRAREVERIA